VSGDEILKREKLKVNEFVLLMEKNIRHFGIMMVYLQKL
jgi:hypothetical protein